MTVVAPGTPELPLLDVSTNAVVARLALPGPSQAIAVSRDGQRGFVAAGSAIVAFDVNTHLELLRTTIDLPGSSPSDVVVLPLELAESVEELVETSLAATRDGAGSRPESTSSSPLACARAHRARRA